MNDALRIPVEEMSQAGEARRLAVPLCRIMRFSEVDISHVSLIVTEIATNLAKHTAGGEILIRSLECAGAFGIEILSIDKGPGMANPSRSQQDGFSMAGSSGTGLGAIKRMSTQFELYSEEGKGTIVMSRYWSGERRKELPLSRLEVGAISIPMKGEDLCGDGWAAEQSASRSVVLLADGLGHGIEAAEASRTAVQLFRENSTKPAHELVRALHAGLGHTRGAALAVAELDHVNRALRYCGIGNISARIIADGGEKALVSHNGVAGLEAPRIREFNYPWDESGLLVMHSDGIATHWRLSDHPGLANRHPSVIAAILYRDFERGRDDATVIVVGKVQQSGRGA